VLYFSYGSNMSVRRLRRRVPSAQAKGPAVLTGHQLRFHKKSRDGSAKLDTFATDRPQDRVIGVLFEIDKTEKKLLDAEEGVGRGYEEKTVTVENAQGKTVRAFTYYATDIDASLKPYHWYKEHALRGARENGLPEDYVQMIESAESVDDQNPSRREDELSIYERE